MLPGFFCSVVKECETDRVNSGGADVGRDSGGLGICCLSDKRKGYIIYTLYRFDAAPFPGDNAVILSDFKQAGAVEYPSGSYPAGDLSYFSCFYYVQWVSVYSAGLDRCGAY